jgi:galactokinase/mevalonate kinase-like predicted kinase
LEVIPLLLGGIQTQYKDAKKIDTDKIDTGKEEMKTGKKMQRRTALGQFSLLISKSLENINKTISEIWSSLSEPIGMTENLKNEFESKLTKAMTAAGLQGADKKLFLLEFYECIDSKKNNFIAKKLKS